MVAGDGPVPVINLSVFLSAILKNMQERTGIVPMVFALKPKDDGHS